MKRNIDKDRLGTLKRLKKLKMIARKKVTYLKIP